MSYLTQTPATQQDFDALEQRIANLERRGRSHGSVHEVGGSDVMRLHVRNAGTALGKQRSLNFGAGLTAAEDQTNKEIDVSISSYAESTWTPVLTFTTPGNLSVVYSTQVGRHVRIGRLVFYGFSIVTSTFTHTTASGNCNITGLPVTSANVAGSALDGVLRWQGITKANYTQVNCHVPVNVTVMDLRASGSGQSNANVTATDMPTTGSIVLVGAGFYEAA